MKLQNFYYGLAMGILWWVKLQRLSILDIRNTGRNTCSINATSLTCRNEVQSASVAIAGNQQPLLNTLKTNKQILQWIKF